jgi:hypothetical protein
VEAGLLTTSNGTDPSRPALELPERCFHSDFQDSRLVSTGVLAATTSIRLRQWIPSSALIF